MIFNSFEFLVFFIIVAGLFFTIPRTWRWLLMLLASYYFYMAWDASLVILILISTVVDYGVGIGLRHTAQVWKRRLLLAISIATNIGLLLYFKYTLFFLDTARMISEHTGTPLDIPVVSIVLPLGISFYTFQTLGYTIDVYRKKIQPETHFGTFALFVTFFPQLVAGPIERAKDLIPQLSSGLQAATIEYDRIVSGLRLMGWGLFKKVVIADTLAKIVNPVYADVGSFSSLTLILVTMAFGYQIYCDFSGYVDIARGAARIFGIRLSRNFKRPYAATSVANFWRRWHITLYDWFKEYIYIPLGGSRKGVARWAVNVMIVFFISGLWHGASWHFVVWGLLHGLFIIVERAISKRIRTTQAGEQFLDGTFGTVSRVVTTYVAIHVAWVFFRAESVPHAFTILGSLSALPADILNAVSLLTEDLMLLLTHSVYMMDIMAVVVCILGVEIVQRLADRAPAKLAKAWSAPTVRYGYFLTVILVLGLFLQEEAAEFIYFQF